MESSSLSLPQTAVPAQHKVSWNNELFMILSFLHVGMIAVHMHVDLCCVICGGFFVCFFGRVL